MALMGEANVKKAQSFQISLTGSQRYLLSRLFLPGTVSQLLEMAGEKPDERPSKKERGEYNRALEAMSFADFDEIEDPKTVEEARALDRRLDVMEPKALTLTFENVRVIQDQINAAHKVKGLLLGPGIRKLGPIEQLLDECKDGKHAILVDES